MAVVFEVSDPVLYERRGAVAWITLNRPRYGNAQNAQLLYALDDAWCRANREDAVGAIVLAGNGKHFSGGHDIGTPGRDADETALARRTMWPDHVGKGGAEAAFVREQELYLEMCRRWRDSPKPTVAAVQGACIAGGLMLAWVCDMIVASVDAFFQDPVLAMGVPGVEYFAHAYEMHPRIAREFLYLGERMPAERAYQLGMVNRVVARDRLETEAGIIAEKLAARPRFGIALAKQAFNAQDDAAGKRQTMTTAFGLHHLAHAHNQLTSGSGTAGIGVNDIRTENL